MADSSNLVSHLSDSHWQKTEDVPNKDDFTKYRLTKRMDKGSGKVMYLAQQVDGQDNIFQLTMSDIKNGDPFKGVQMISLAINQEQKTIVGVLSIDGDYFVRKD